MTQAAHDPPARIRRVDNGVDLEVRRRIDGLTPFIGLAYEKLEGSFMLRRIVDRRELFSEGTLTAPSRPMAPNSPEGQEAVKKESWKPPPAMAIAQTIAFSQDDRKQPDV